MIPFDAEFATRSAQEFIDDVLVGALGATRVAWARTSASATRRRATRACSPPTSASRPRVAPLLEVDGEIVSSSHIRGLVLAGERVDVRRPPARRAVQVQGEVVHGDERGRELGFPTANLVPRTGSSRPATASTRAARPTGTSPAVNVGVRPMFKTGRGELIEAYLLDFDGDLYGSELRLEFLERLRGERRFDSVDALVEQMHRDVERRASSSRPLAPDVSLLPFPAAMTLTPASASARSPRSSAPASRTPATPGPGRAAHRAHQPPHRAPARRTRRTTTRAAAC